MYKLCVFAGTTEGRELVEFLCTQPVEVTACVATEHGEQLLPQAENLTVSAHRMDREEMTAFLASAGFDLVIDATHPYAAAVTENLTAACRQSGTPCMRLRRDGSAAPEEAVFVEDTEGAVRYLAGTEGPVLLTTGSKELARFAALPGFADRVWARVLPMEESLALCREAGLAPSHIIAMQGPFSREMNLATLKSLGARYMVTKESGRHGGFEEKVTAAREAGARLVVIGRPVEAEGYTFDQVMEQLQTRFGLTWKPKVALVGLGPGAAEAMTGQVRRAVERADCIIGADRMVEAVLGPGQTGFCAIRPREIADYIRTHREHRSFAVVMSGDVGFFSGAKKLLPLLDFCQVTVLPGLSSLVCLCARLGTSYEDVVPVSIHGRDHDLIPDVRRHKRLFTLVGGRDGMKNLCRALADAGLGDVTVSVGERLSYPDEKVTVGTARQLAEQDFAVLSVALIENPGAGGVVTHGLPDSAFQRGAGEEGVVPMTKSEVRSVSLSKLALREDSICWDVGAGTGSVAIEMALQAPCGAVYAIERKEAALELLEHNRVRFGLSNMTVVPGIAPEACRDLPAPTHAFIGGSSGNMRQIIELLLEKNPAVRIVATAIALESVAELTACLKHFNFTEHEVVSLSVARSRKAGPYHLMTSQNPIYIFTMQGGTQS